MPQMRLARKAQREHRIRTLPLSMASPYAPPFEEEIEPTAAELWLASLSDEEFFNLTKRIRGDH
jgi:hypothetical protein